MGENDFLSEGLLLKRVWVEGSDIHIPYTQRELSQMVVDLRARVRNFEKNPPSENAENAYGYIESAMSNLADIEDYLEDAKSELSRLF
jgi:hypothetical protein